MRVLLAQYSICGGRRKEAVAIAVAKARQSIEFPAKIALSESQGNTMQRTADSFFSPYRYARAMAGYLLLVIVISLLYSVRSSTEQCSRVQVGK